ncbi:FAD-dependent monooxygenase sdnN [Cladobotryum mycophilum]|uniref:FAD-dependent monooxygenase sdnN n=1 Tax=Cladobotryum mycophilum TaxID=491253 RepID=A0ABR0SNT2_9HYPO
MASPFRVIIVGGGPVGLTAAHALHLAGVDFVLLERRESIAADEGAAIVIGPPSLRVLAQMGLFDKLREVGGEMNRKKTFLWDGTVIKNRSHFGLFRENHGITSTGYQRTDLVQTLYDCLPETTKSNVLTGKRVVDIESNEHMAKVTCADGSSYEGNMVLGTDGTHSNTRQLMRKLALEADPKADWDPEQPYLSTYRVLWCRFPRESQIGDAYETQHTDCAMMYFVDKEHGTIFMYEKLPEPTRERVFYTEDDAKAFVERMEDCHFAEGTTVKDVFHKRTSLGMANLEEGLTNYWSWGRIVLAGDACHKFTPNAGSGYQVGIQDIVSLSNHLRKAIDEEPSSLPSTEALQTTFKAYQEQRSERVQTDQNFSASVIRMQTWATTFYYFMARYFMSTRLFDYLVFNLRSARLNSECLVLDYVAAEEPFTGKVPWKCKIKSPLEAKD